VNNSLERVFDDLVRLLRDDVVPQLGGDALRSQVFGAIFMLKNLQLRCDWSTSPLAAQIRAQDALFEQLRGTGIGIGQPGAAALPVAPRIAAELPSGAELLALRDAGNALVCGLIEAGTAGPAGALIDGYMRAELDLEMRHTPKPMFAEMSSGQSQPTG
jgi:hypothetical protein